MNQIRNVIDQQLTPPETQRTSQTATEDIPPSTDKARGKKKPQGLDYALPSRQKADYLLDTYWRLVHTLYPFLYHDDIVSTYQCLWTGQDLNIGDEEPTFLCFLNVIFSISCVLDPSIKPEDCVAFADVFYQRARGLLDFDLIQRKSIITVQCFLLLGQYLQSTNDP